MTLVKLIDKATGESTINFGRFVASSQKILRTVVLQSVAEVGKGFQELGEDFWHFHFDTSHF